MKIQIRFNEEGALRNQRYAFTDRFTLVTELLQNARRAGARHIIVEHRPEDQVLRVVDDGQGVENFQKLLSFHESGWNESLADQEHPFGVGFTKCLYAVTRIVATSGHRQVDIDTAAALRCESFDVTTTPLAVNGTAIELHGVEINDLAEQMETLCEGFPVDVAFNGTPMARRYAEDKIALSPTPIGAVHVSGNRDGKATYATLVFLQGFCVHRPRYVQADAVNVVHLDPQQFMARLPDRDQLIDADQQLKRVDAQVKQSWRGILEVAKTQLKPRDFVATYFDAMLQWQHQDLLNDMDELPAALFQRIAGYPIQTHYGERDYTEPVGAAPTRSDIESGSVTLVSLDAVSEENAAHWMLARQKQWLLADAYRLDAGHWLHPHVRYIDGQEAAIEPQVETARATLEGRWVWPQIVLCESIRIRVGEHEAVLVDDGVCHDGNLLIPANEVSGESALQLSDFVDENERYRDDDAQADCAALADLIRRLRSTDPVATLSSLLSELGLGKYALLHGRRFEVTVGVGGMPGCSVELVGAEDAPASDGDGHAER